MPKISAKKMMDKAVVEERRLQRESSARDKAARKGTKPSGKPTKSLDSFVNFTAKLGIGADNLFSSGTYGFNPITRQRTLLEWIYRGSWIGGVAIDCIADDMTRAGVTILGSLKPEQRAAIQETATRLDVWGAINDNIKWARLYGGSIAVHLIDGQDYSKPLNPNSIAKGQYKGMLVLDRHMVAPSVNNLVTEVGPYMGMPKFYDVNDMAPGLRGKKIHYSRCIRLEGIRLPYWQRLTENLWGESEFERFYDRLIAFDSATTGAAQLVYKAYIRTYAIDGLRQVVSIGGEALEGLLAQVEFMRAMQNSEGITLMDTKDKFEAQQTVPFSGLAEALVHFGQQISGALQIPLVRLFGQSPAGLNSTGESDLRNYYDGILQRQERTLGHSIHILYRMLAFNEGIRPPQGYGIRFNPLWQLTEIDKSEIASRDTETFSKAVESGLVTPVVAMREMRNSSQKTDRWTAITDEVIDEAEAMDQVPMATQVEVAEVKAGETPDNPDPKPGEGGTQKPRDRRRKT